MSSPARDSCGEGQATFYQVSSKTLWRKFPIKVFIDESRYPGSEPKSEARLGIKRVIDAINRELNFSFFSITLDKSRSNFTIRFDSLSSGIGLAYYRYTNDKETFFADVTLHTGTNWFINPYHQCYSSGRRFHMPATVAHEVGHAIGLGHNSTDNKSTMRSFSQAGETLRETYGLSERTFMHKFYDRYIPSPNYFKPV